MGRNRAGSHGITVVQMGLDGGFGDLQRVTLVADRHFLLPIAAAITQIRRQTQPQQQDSK